MNLRKPNVYRLLQVESLFLKFYSENIIIYLNLGNHYHMSTPTLGLRVQTLHSRLSRTRTKTQTQTFPCLSIHFFILQNVYNLKFPQDLIRIFATIPLVTLFPGPPEGLFPRREAMFSMGRMKMGIPKQTTQRVATPPSRTKRVPILTQALRVLAPVSGPV